jgi:hypothetical protein
MVIPIYSSSVKGLIYHVVWRDLPQRRDLESQQLSVFGISKWLARLYHPYFRLISPSFPRSDVIILFRPRTHPSLCSLSLNPCALFNPISKSAPAQNILPFPVTTIAFTLSSRSSISNARTRPCSISEVNALFFSTRSIEMMIIGVTAGEEVGWCEREMCLKGRLAYEVGLNDDAIVKVFLNILDFGRDS